MAILIGIDEAGYGPILGPLVVSAAAFELPDEHLKTPLWKLLRQSLCKKRLGSTGRIVVNDSKKLHQGRGKYAALQRGVLAFLAADSADHPATVGHLLNRLDCPCHDQLAQYPWYGLATADWPLKYDRDDIAIAAASLNRDLAANHVRLLGLTSRLLPVGAFNELIDTMNNKASVLFYLGSQLIYQAWQTHQPHDLQFLIDKQGGRSHYRKPLQRMFPDLHLKILKETDTTSSYELAGPSRTMRIHFLAKGDDRQLPIALASMTSKYLRELFMEILNAHFARHCPAIAPTAGYYQDGTRFLQDLKEANLDPKLTPTSLLVRQR